MIKLIQGFDVCARLPIDGRILLSKEDMGNINPDVFPDKYFAICKDDGKLYLFDKSKINPITSNTGWSPADDPVEEEISELDERLSGEISDLNEDILDVDEKATEIASNLQTEVETREDQYSNLNGRITGETSLREEADRWLTRKINAEESKRASDDAALDAKIDNYKENKNLVDETELNEALEVYSKTDDTGNLIDLSIDPNFVLNVVLKNSLGDELDSSFVDLPLEELIVDGYYDNDPESSTYKNIILTLKGPTDSEGNPKNIYIPVGDLVDGLVDDNTFSSHIDDDNRHVTEELQTKWNTHVDNEDIHVEKSEKDDWNAHIIDTDIHVSEEDRRNWDSPVAPEDLINIITEGENVHVVKVDDKLEISSTNSTYFPGPGMTVEQIGDNAWRFGTSYAEPYWTNIISFVDSEGIAYGPDSNQELLDVLDKKANKEEFDEFASQTVEDLGELNGTVETQGETLSALSGTVETLSGTVETQGETLNTLSGTVETQGETLSALGETVVSQGDRLAVVETGKVDKVSGLGLSQENFTSGEKTKLTNIAENAQVNVLEGVQVNGTDLVITNKKVNVKVPTKTSDLPNDGDGASPFATQSYVAINGGKIDSISVNGTTQSIDDDKNVDIDVPTNTSDLTNDSDFAVDANYVHTDNNFTQELKAKLEGVAAGAQVNVIETVNVNNSPLTVTNKAVNIDLSNYATKSDIASVYKYKGSVDRFSELPTSGQVVGDVWNVKEAYSDQSIVIKAGDNVAWTNDGWDVLAGVVDLTGYYTKSEIDNKHFAVDANYVHTDNNFTTDLKNKLTGISAGANKVTATAKAGSISIDGGDAIQIIPDNVVVDNSYKHITVTGSSVSDGTNTFNKYTHPTNYTTYNGVFGKVTVENTGHVSNVVAATAADIRNLTPYSAAAAGGLGLSDGAFSIKYATVTIGQAESWTSSGWSYYRDESLEGVTSNSHPVIDLDMSSATSVESLRSLMEDWSNIYRVESTNTGLRFWSTTNSFTNDLVVKVRGY